MQPVTVTNRDPREPPPPPPSPPPKVKKPKLPKGWRTAKDQDGKVYYYHSITRYETVAIVFVKITAIGWPISNIASCWLAAARCNFNDESYLTNYGLEEMAAILQTTTSND